MVLSDMITEWELMGIEDEEQIWNILTKNPYAMNKLRQIASGGTMVLSDMLTEWELGIGALQSKIIRKIAAHFNDEQNINNDGNDNDKKENDKECNDKNKSNGNTNDDTKDPEKGDNDKSNDNNNDTANGNADVDKKADQ